MRVKYIGINSRLVYFLIKICIPHVFFFNEFVVKIANGTLRRFHVTSGILLKIINTIENEYQFNYNFSFGYLSVIGTMLSTVFPIGQQNKFCRYDNPINSCRCWKKSETYVQQLHIGIT